MSHTIPGPLNGKVALVTGGSRGIGAAVAKVFADHGCSHLAITYNQNADLAQANLAAIQKARPDIVVASIQAEVTDPDFGPKLVQQALSQLKVDRIDIVVNNASFTDAAKILPLDDITKEYWDAWQAAEVWAPLTLARAAVKVMPAGGRIIMMSSASSRLPFGNASFAGACCKSAVEAMVRNMGVLYAPKGITVNSIGVGPTKTEAMMKMMDLLPPEQAQFVYNFTIPKRIAEPEEVANIVAFVASPQASWITSNQIPANGGALAVMQS